MRGRKSTLFWDSADCLFGCVSKWLVKKPVATPVNAMLPPSKSTDDALKKLEDALEAENLPTVAPVQSMQHSIFHRSEENKLLLLSFRQISHW